VGGAVTIVRGCGGHAIEGWPTSTFSRWRARPQAAGYGWRRLDSAASEGRGAVG
jgi:hypothetical protein